MPATVWSEWGGLGTAALALVVSVAAWRAAARSAKATEQQAAADQEAAHLVRSPRLELRLGLDHGDGTVEAELINRGPVALHQVSFEVATHWSADSSQPGMVLRHDQSGAEPSSAGEFGPFEVGDRRELQVSHTDFWLRLICVASDGERWTCSLEVPAMSGPIGRATSTTLAAPS